MIQELGLSFTTAVELPTGCSEVELIPGGAQVDVTKERPKSLSFKQDVGPLGSNVRYGYVDI